MKKILCFGTFDLLHLGHLDYLKQAKLFGGHLTVVIARDQTKLEQGKIPLFNEQERLEIIKNLRIVDEAILGNLGNYLKVVEELKPDVVVLGYDHEIGEDELKKRLKFSLEVKKAKPFQVERYKSKIIKNKIIEISRNCITPH